MQLWLIGVSVIFNYFIVQQKFYYASNKKSSSDWLYSQRYLNPDDVLREKDRRIESILIQGYSHGCCRRKKANTSPAEQNKSQN